MRTPGHRLLALAVVIFGLAVPLAAQEKEKPLPPADRAPHLILAHAGPHAPVTALAFAPDASTLYVGGFDKQVRRYALVKGKYVANGTFRVPIGSGNAGVVNAVAVSPDGKWVAVAGRAPLREETWASADDGVYDEDVRQYPPFLRRDVGVVYLFDPTKPDGGKVIRGPRAAVRALAFANPAPATGPVLLTAGIEWNEKKGQPVGTVRVFNATTGDEIASRDDLPATAIRPGLAAWATGAKKDGLRVAVAWDGFDDQTGKPLPGKLLTWDNPKTNGGTDNWEPKALLISPLAVRIGKDGTATELLNGGYDETRNTGGLNVRPASGGEPKTVPLKGENGRLLLPTALAAFPLEGGDGTAMLLPVGADADGQRYELRLLTPTAERSVTLGGFHPRRPVLSASPDGRFVAVAGFKDHRVEVYPTAAFAAGKPVRDQLKGDTHGFGKVAFLVGENLVGDKLWLGAATDTPDTGGVVLDLDRAARVAIPRAAKDALKVDAPTSGTATILKVEPPERFARRVSVTVAGQTKIVTLPAGHYATAAAVLPGKPAWDVTLGPIAAVAHVHDYSQTVLVTLYDLAPEKPKPLYQFGGPTLPVRSLAFSGSRALLAGAGDDGTVAVWSLKNVGRTFSVIEGLLLTARDGALVVASVQTDSPAAAAKIKEGEVIESVGDAKGAQKPVKSLSDFLTAVRALKSGDSAQIKVKGRPAVAVAVGTGVGFRYPLFTLWVDPSANEKDGKHAWVGWTSSGPYDASGETGERRIGWLTATGDPARPTTFAGANQYRKLFYTPDFIRLLLKTADYNEALALIPPLTPPTLTAVFVGGTELRDGRAVAREKLDGVNVTLNDPDRVLDLDRAELQWRAVGPGAAPEWNRESFAAGRATLDLSKHDWKRGEHRVHIKLFKTGATAPLHEVTIGVLYVPQPPVVAVKIDGKAPAHGVEIATLNEEVEVTATADAKGNPDGAAVTLSWTGGKPVELARNPDGTFAPAKVKLKAGSTTVILATATNRGDGAKADIESHSVEVRVRRLVPDVVPPPTVTLAVLTPFDFRALPDSPFVVSTPTATLTATVQDKKNPISEFQWKIGGADWKDGKLDPATGTATLDVPLPQTDEPLVVQVRAKSKASEYATDAATVRFDGLPEVTVTMPPVVVTVPELKLSGGLKVVGKRDFKVRVLVTSSRTGRTREIEPTPDAAFTKWDAGITLFPGENQLGYVITYDGDRKELRRAGLVEVRYVRPPVVIGAAPVDVGTGAAGDVALAVVSARDAAPAELWVNGARVGFRTHAKPVQLFGVGLWLIKAEGVPVHPGADRLKPVVAVVRNAERESQPFALEVRGRQEVIIPPPTVRLSHKGNPVTPEQALPPVGDSSFTFDLKVASETRLTRVEVWYGIGAAIGLEQVGEVKLSDAVAVGGGFELTARPTLRLRAGARNHVRVVASNAGGTVAVAFNVSYAPPPVRVVIDSIREPNGKVIPLSPGSANALTVDKAMIDVEGRVLWDFDDEPIGRDPNLTVTFVANGVAHLPVAVQPAKDGNNERRFVGRVYLNTLDPDPKAPGVTRVRADLRSGARPVPIPQEGLAQAGFAVTSSDPLRRQRLHVLVLGVEVPDADRKELVRRVVKAVGGELPPDNPHFTEGRFARDGFEFAYLYAPRLGYTKAGDLNALLSAARTDIERRTKRPGEEWVNDVIVVYYQGEDWVDADGRWLLHSATTLSGAAGKNPAEYAIRLDNLPQIPGMPVAVVNVASTAKPGSTLAIDLPYLRYAWANNAAAGELLPQIALAIRAERTVEQMAKRVGLGLDGVPVANRPTRAAFLPDDVLARVIGLKKP